MNCQKRNRLIKNPWTYQDLLMCSVVVFLDYLVFLERPLRSSQVWTPFNIFLPLFNQLAVYSAGRRPSLKPFSLVFISYFQIFSCFNIFAFVYCCRATTGDRLQPCSCKCFGYDEANSFKTYVIAFAITICG